LTHASLKRIGSGILAGALAFAAPLPVFAADGSDADTFKYLSLFGDVFERVKSDYVDEVSDEKLIEAAISGMLSSLDPHSSYMNKDSFSDMRVQTKGEFGGLGIEVTLEDGAIKVVSPIEDTPAFKAGLQPNDLIIALDGEPVAGLDLQAAVDKMRGPVGTDIKLTVKRGDQTFDVSLTRDVVKIRSVRHETYGDVGYIRITSFNEQAEPGLLDAVSDIKKKIGENKVEGYILDLRFNPGGLLDQAVAVSDAFLDSGEIVSTRSRRNDNASRFNATPGDIINGKPLVVLINGGSASASEIVSGALQDHHRAVIMGTRSFGKGSVQTIIPLSGGSALRLTTQRYYTPSGRSIQAKGIEPDITVPQAHLEEVKLNIQREGDLKGALDVDNKSGNPAAKPGDATTPADGKVPTDAKAPGAAAPATGEPVTKPASDEDYQLMRAIDLLHGVALFKQSAN
jgi:carboxyl-terminal processing protease